MRLLLVLLIFCILSACDLDYKRLEEYTYLKENYTKEEFKGLERILGFYDQKICEQCKGCNTANASEEVVIDCYYEYFEILEDSLEQDHGLHYPISGNELVKLLISLDSSLFYDIWWIPCETREESFKYEGYMEVSLEGRYIDFLAKLKQRNLRLYWYLEDTEAAGTSMTPRNVSEIIKNHHLYDLKDEGIRLFIIIHYMTLFSQYYE